MVKTDFASGLAVPVSADVVASAKEKATRPPRTFAPKPDTKPEDLRAVFDDTCDRYPKTLSRLAE